MDIALEWDERPALIPPLLLITFIENAFQYGLHPTRPCYLHIHLCVEDGELLLDVSNSIIVQNTATGNGLGIDNARRRLLQIYPNLHTLDFDVTEQQHRVTLQIQLNPVPKSTTT
ncbi:MAG: hypothetical protein R2795_19685 [Saprospiraceae bacterium]